MTELYLEVFQRLLELPLWAVIVIGAFALVWKALSLLEKVLRRDP